MFNAIRVSGLLQVASAAALSIALFMGVSSPLKAASFGEDKATVTFDRPVEVPGKVLPPGTYVFKTVENNEMVQVFSANEKQLFATVSVIPSDRPVQESRMIHQRAGNGLHQRSQATAQSAKERCARARDPWTFGQHATREAPIFPFQLDEAREHAGNAELSRVASINSSEQRLG